MDSSSSQQSYLSLYAKYINSTPNIYGLHFRSKKTNIQKLSAHSEPENQDTSNINTQPKQVASCIELPTIQEQSNLENDTESNFSAIIYQQGIDSICEKQIQAQLNQNDVNRLIQAIQIHGKAHSLIAQELNMPIQLIQRQIYNLFKQIEETTVSDKEWTELVPGLNIWDLNPFSFYHSISQDQINILSSFKAAFKVTKNQKFSAQYCCGKFGVEARLVNTLVRQALTNISENYCK
ncbi:Hypothetical_protein [Hexamita inflata]|uniref:Hypothetical_protein n=1 Tax=Hexamita inflata TaxID=28002 RepID=A0AA86RPS3_9EUKA|nr:Hypothetical protein HINF_LOCUS63472 [Hexamita inflata]